jgi:hypothetical protein
VAVEEDLVILDVAADRYLCLPGCAADVRLAASARALRIASPDLAADFRAAGLLANTPAEIQPYRAALAPVQSAVASVYPPVEWRDASAIAAAVWDVLRRYRGRALADILRARAASGPRRCGEPSRDLLAVVDRFQRWIPYAPLSGKCLLRSFVLLGCLRRCGHDAHWVFGVATWPFRAHCWLQCGGTVLDDHVERVRVFHPILVA